MFVRHLSLPSSFVMHELSCLLSCFTSPQEQSSKMRKYVIESVKKYIEVWFFLNNLEELAEVKWNFVVHLLMLHWLWSCSFALLWTHFSFMKCLILIFLVTSVTSTDIFGFRNDIVYYCLSYISVCWNLLF